MNMNRLLSNCPNCGAPLTADGYCSYCNTKVRYANEIEYQTFFNNGCITNISATEILFKFKADDGTIVILPFVGKPESIEVIYDTQDYVDYDGDILYKVHSSPTVNFNMSGFIIPDLMKGKGIQ